MPGDRERENENYQYFRTTCGLIGFIVFFLGSFLAFIVAEETGIYYEYTIIFGFAMLIATISFFCCVLKESKKIHLSEYNEPQAEQELLLQPQPEPESSGQSPPYWADRTRTDLAYTREVLKFPPKSSNETTSSENDSGPEMLELQNMAKLSDGGKESILGISRESQDNDTTGYEDAADFQLDFAKAGLSTVAGKSSESKYDDIPFMDMSSLSLSNSSKSIINTVEQPDVSVALSQLSLDNSEKQVATMPSQDTSSTDPEGKSDDHSQHSETSIKAKGGESELESKKEA